MGKHDNGEDGSQVEVIMPDGFGSSFSTQQIRAKVFREFLVSHGTNPFFSDIGYLAPVIWKNLCTLDCLINDQDGINEQGAPWLGLIY